MAPVASGSTVPLKLHSIQKPKPPSPFLGKKLNLKPSSRTTITSNPKTLAVVASSGGEFLDAVHNLFLGVGVGLPCTVMECGDIIYRSTLPKPSGLTLTVPGAALALGTLSYPCLVWFLGSLTFFFLLLLRDCLGPLLRRMTLFWGRSWVRELLE